MKGLRSFFVFAFLSLVLFFANFVSAQENSGCVGFGDLTEEKDVFKLSENLISASEGKVCITYRASKAVPFFGSVDEDLLRASEIRKDLLFDLIEKDPERALEVPEIPEEVQVQVEGVKARKSTTIETDDLFEKRGEFVGETTLYHVDDFENRESDYWHILNVENDRFQMFSSEKLPLLESGTEVKVKKGLALATKMAVGKNEEGNVLSVIGVPPGSPASENFGE